VETTPLQ
jgi:hypothetical protein